MVAILLESLKRGSKSGVEFRAGDMAQLRFGIVNVVEVDAFEIHVSQRLIQLVL